MMMLRQLALTRVSPRLQATLGKSIVGAARPFSAPTVDETSTSSSAEEKHHPKLVEVPSLPFLGSLFTQYSGTPKLQEDNLINWWRDVNNKYGEFYSFGMPGMGTGLRGTVNVVRDHLEFLKVLKHEGTYPSGLVQTEWPVIDWMNKKKFSSIGFMGRSSEWKRIRTFLQKDLLSPASAKEYLPAIIKGAAKNSPNAPKFAAENNLNRYLNYCAIDMFSGVFLGTQDAGISEVEYNMFCETGVEALVEVFAIMREPKELLAHAIGYETSRVKRFCGLMDTVDELARKRMKWFLGRMERGELSEDEKSSYFAKSVERQKNSDVTKEELFEIGMVMLVASVDTTASKAAWNILQLALHPQFQDDLYKQIDQAVQKQGGLTPAFLDRGQVPLLHCLVRETHRCTPPSLFDLMKKNETPIVIHGKEFPPGTAFVFDSITKQLDPNLVDDPMTFKPERWLPEHVEARKGTPAAILDHVFYSGPFSQGARRCPGSRVASIETQAIVAQLLLDWKIEGPENVHWKDIRGSLGTFFNPTFPKEVQFVPR